MYIVSLSACLVVQFLFVRGPYTASLSICYVPIGNSLLPHEKWFVAGYGSEPMSDERERDSSGRYVESITPEAVLGSMKTANDPVVTTKEIADELGCTPEAARLKLVELHKQGKVERKQVGGRAVVWWASEEVD